MSPNLIILNGTHDPVVRSRREPNALVAQVDSSTLARLGVGVKVPRRIFLFIVAVTAHPGAIVDTAELGDMLYGDREDGGPESIGRAFNSMAFQALPALMALGYRLDVHHGRGASVRCCLGASPLTYGDLAHDQELLHG